MKFKNIIVLFLIIGMAISVAGCDTVSQFNQFTELERKVNVSDGIIAQNEKFELKWDSKKARILLYDKISSKIFSTSPSALIDNEPTVTGIKNHPKAESPIAVTYFDKQNYIEKTSFAYVNSITKNNISAKEINNGISVEYSFETEKFSVTVDYILNEDNVEISIDTSKIKEDSQNIVTKVVVAPFMCSMENDDENSYIFIPSGSGAIINNINKLNSLSIIEEQVYGKDYSLSEVYNFSNTEEIRMPVFGVKNSDSGMFAIIKKGVEASTITTMVGDDNIGFSSVYASFLLRGEDVVETPKDFGGVSGQIYSDPINNQIFSVAYYPLLNSDCSYIDMAYIYRNYLNDAYNLTDISDDIDESIVHINFVGGTEYNANFFGIPYKKIFKLTDISAVDQITDQIVKMLGKDISTALIGYGISGMSIGKIAGGFKLNSILASEEKMAEYFNKCKDNSIPTFLDVDTIRFNKSNLGFSTGVDAAVTVNGKRADLTIKDIWSGTAGTNAIHYRLISRDELENVNDKLMKYFNNEKFLGISLGTLTSITYSDYSDISTYAKLGMTYQVSNILKKYKQSGISVLSSDANDYAAAKSDFIMNVPTNSSGYDVYDMDIPFYQIVFKGYIPMASKPVNTSYDFDKAILHCIESGITPSFTLGKEYDTELVNSESYDIYAYNEEYIMNKLKELHDDGIFDDISKLKNAKIVSHEILDNNVRKTTYDNGIVVYVNYGDENFTDGIINIDAKGYVLKEE